MISIVIAMRSLWACKILNRDKSIEVRKGLALYNALKKAEERGEEVQFLMYVTKASPTLYGPDIYKRFHAILGKHSIPNALNGKVVARFALKKYEKIYWEQCSYEDEKRLKTSSLRDCELADKACLEIEKLYDYFADGDSVGSALYIEDLEIFDKPKDLADYGLKRAPQSWCYAKEI